MLVENGPFSVKTRPDTCLQCGTYQIRPAVCCNYTLVYQADGPPARHLLHIYDALAGHAQQLQGVRGPAAYVGLVRHCTRELQTLQVGHVQEWVQRPCQLHGPRALVPGEGKRSEACQPRQCQRKPICQREPQVQMLQIVKQICPTGLIWEQLCRIRQTHLLTAEAPLPDCCKICPGIMNHEVLQTCDLLWGKNRIVNDHNLSVVLSNQGIEIQELQTGWQTSKRLQRVQIT